MKWHLRIYGVVTVATAALVAVVTLAERYDSCGINCGIWLVGGLAAILLTGATLLALRETVRLRSLAALAVSFTLATTIAGTVSEWLLYPRSDRNEIILLAMFFPVFGTIATFAACLVVTIVVQSVRSRIRSKRT